MHFFALSRKSWLFSGVDGSPSSGFKGHIIAQCCVASQLRTLLVPNHTRRFLPEEKTKHHKTSFRSMKSLFFNIGHADHFF